MFVQFIRDFYASPGVLHVSGSVIDVSAQRGAELLAIGAVLAVAPAPNYLLGVSYTIATLPSAAADGMNGSVAFVSDVGAGIYVRSNGTRWLPINGSAFLFRSSATEPAFTTAAETDRYSVPLPIGLWKDGDSLRCYVRGLKSGESDSVGLITRINTTPSGITGTNIFQLSQPTSTNNDGMAMWFLKRLSPTTVRGAPSSSGFGATGAAAPAVATVSDMDANQSYLHITSTITGGGGETLTLADFMVEWLPAYN